jgi:hypothetical protein
MVKQPAPISLRLRAERSTARAYALLNRLDEEDRAQKKIKWIATKAKVLVKEMKSVASLKLRSGPHADDVDRFEVDCLMLESMLIKISKRGVRP